MARNYDFAPKKGVPGINYRNKDGSLTWKELTPELERQMRDDNIDIPGLVKDWNRRYKERTGSDYKPPTLSTDSKPDKEPPIPRGLGLGAQRGEPVIGTDATSKPTQAPTQTPTQTQAPASIPAPTPAKTYKVPGYGDMTKDEIKKRYDKLRYNDDGTMKSADQLGDASKFGRAANQAIYKFKKPGPNPLMKRYKQPSVEEAYEVVLDYLLSEGHADTLEEANYVMMQLDAEYIQSIVEMGMPDPIDPIKHKAAQKTQKIYNKAKGGAGSEKDFLKRTGPQLPGV